MSPSKKVISSSGRDQKPEEPPLRRLLTALRYGLVGIKFLLAQWQVLGIGVAVLLAWAFPNVGRRGGSIQSQYIPLNARPLTRRYTVSYGAIGIIFLISGLSIQRQALVDNSSKLRLHLVVQITSYLVCNFERFV